MVLKRDMEFKEFELQLYKKKEYTDGVYKEHTFEGESFHI